MSINQIKPSVTKTTNVLAPLLNIFISLITGSLNITKYEYM